MRARLGDERGLEPGARDIDTLVVLAHHDAPQTGILFDQTLQRRPARARPAAHRELQDLAAAVVDRASPGRCARSPPRCRGRRRPACAACVHRRARRRRRDRRLAQPDGAGANDNLSGVAALIVARRAAARAPAAGPACAAGLLWGRGDARRTAYGRSSRDTATSSSPGARWFANLDTVGSPHLVLLEAEGPVWMESYAGPWLRDLLATCAEQAGVELRAASAPAPRPTA